MSEYYAVQRSDEYLAHYGVKGMKWGVRKAIASGSDKKMAKAYARAQKHLNKLKTRANIDAQKTNVGVQATKAIGTGLATAGLGGVAYLTKPGLRKTDRSIPGFNFNPASGSTERASIPVLEETGNRTAHYATGALTAAGAAKTAYHAGKAIASKYRTTGRGHAKAVAKANVFQNEMNRAFAGTKYGKQKRRKSRQA